MNINTNYETVIYIYIKLLKVWQAIIKAHHMNYTNIHH